MVVRIEIPNDNNDYCYLVAIALPADSEGKNNFLYNGTVVIIQKVKKKKNKRTTVLCACVCVCVLANARACVRVCASDSIFLVNSKSYQI